VFAQDNVSVSKKGVVRGLHYQKAPNSQGKLVRVLRGSICDVMMNIDTGEVTYTYLDDKEFNAVYVPPNYAHGFQALEDDTLVYYKCTNYYSPKHEAGFSALDLEWPLEITEMSEKDKLLPKWGVES
jgi:dTDP-4-dehydrorhamnose 3,5-epimerase